jgi:hypothetical protein
VQALAHTELVALSCKRRGVVPPVSPAARAPPAVHLERALLPEVTIRVLDFGSVREAFTGAVIDIQRTDTALRRNVHLHRPWLTYAA